MAVVSVIVPTYNSRALLPRTLDSIFDGSAGVDVEVLLSDDASTDGTADWAEQLADRRIRVVRGLNRCGQAAARNRAVGSAEGDWIAATDHDDTWRPGRLAGMLEAAHYAGADLVADDQWVYRPGEQEPRARLLPGHGWPSRPAWLGAADLVDLGLGFLKPLISRRVFATGIRWDERLRLTDDLDFYLRVLLGGFRWWQLDAAWYEYRLQRSSQVRRQLDVQREIVSHSAQVLREWNLGPTLTTSLRRRQRHAQQALAWLEFGARLRSAGVTRTLAGMQLAQVSPLATYAARRISERVWTVTHRWPSSPIRPDATTTSDESDHLPSVAS